MHTAHRTSFAVAALAAALPSLAAAQDPFTSSERWFSAPLGQNWMPEDTLFAGDDAFVWTSLRGGNDSLLLFDAVGSGAADPRGVVARLPNEFGAAAIATGERGDALFALRQLNSPTAYQRAPVVGAYDPRTAVGGMELPLTWVHDMGIRINGPVRLASDREGDIVAAAAWNNQTAQTRVDLLDGTDGTLLGRIDLPAVALSALAISDDGTRVAVACGITLYVLDATAIPVHSGPLGSSTTALDLSADGSVIAYGEIGALNVISELPGGGYVQTLHRTAASNELPSRVAVSSDGTILAIAWWNYAGGLDARFELFDTIFQFPLAELRLPAASGATQNLPSVARITDDGRRAAFGTWGNGSDPEIVVLEVGGFGPALVIDLPGSVRGLDFDATGTQVICGHKDVHNQSFGATGTLRLIDSGERNLQLLATPRLGGSVRAAARRPGAFGGWFILGPEATVPTQFPGAVGTLLLQRNRLMIHPRTTDATGRIDLTLPLPNSPALVGRQLHLQAAFRTPQGLEFTPHLVSPFVLN